MNKKTGILSICCAIAIGSLTAKELTQDNKLIKGQLDNGLTYYVYPNDNPKGEAVYRLFIKSGSLYEKENQRGLAHFLEHMAFNGSKDFPSGTLIGYLQSKGAGFGVDINAHTAMNETVYKLQLPSNSASFVDSSLMVLSNWASELTLDSAAIEKERGIILSEWLTRTGPKSDANNAFLLELLNSSQYSKRLTIGDTAVIKNFTHDKLRDYYRDWYNPRLMAVAVCGDVDPVQVEKGIKDRFSSIEGPKLKIPDYKIDNYASPDYNSVGNKGVTKIELSIIQLTEKPEAVRDEKSYFEYLKRALLNNLMKERFNTLTFESPSYLSPSIGISSLLNTKGVLIGSVELKPDKVMEGIRDYAYEAERIYRYGFLPLEIEKVKKAYASSIQRSSTSQRPKDSKKYMDEVYSDFYVGNMIITPKAEYELMKKYIGSIDSAMIIKQLRKIRKPQQTHYFLTYSDKIEGRVPTKEQVLPIFDSLRSALIEPYSKFVVVPDELLPNLPKGGEIVKKEYIKEIDAYRMEMSNGAFVTFKRSDLDKDKISFGGFRRGGLSALDSMDYVSGQFAGNVIPISGAGEFSRDALRYFMSGSSVSARFIIEKNRSGIIGGANMSDMEQMFQLVYLKWCFPKMDTTILNQSKKLTIESYRNAPKTDADKFNRDVYLLLNGNNYTTKEMTDTVVNEQLDEQRLLPIFNMNFGGAKDYEFVVVANCDVDSIAPYITKYLGSLPASVGNTEYKYTGPTIPRADTTLVRQASDNPKAVVSMFFQNDKPIAELRRQNLVGEISKGIIRTELLNTLRERMNMIYSVGVSAGATVVPAPLNRITISFSCKSEDVDTLVNQTMNVLRRMVEDQTSFQTEMDDVKLNVNKNWNAERQKSMYWSAGIRNVLYRADRDWSYLVDYDKIVDSITTIDVANYVKEHILESCMLKAVLLPKAKESMHMPNKE